MIVIGVTGRIGSGKSSVLENFETKGVPTFLFDKACHEAYFDDAIKERVREEFGSGVFADGQVSRKALADIVFSQKWKLIKLQEAIRPFVQAALSEWIDENKESKFGFVESAVLLDSEMARSNCDYILVVTSQHGLERASTRDDASLEEIEKRAALQMSEIDMMKQADFVIKNDGDQMELYTECSKFYASMERYMSTEK